MIMYLMLMKMMMIMIMINNAPKRKQNVYLLIEETNKQTNMETQI